MRKKPNILITNDDGITAPGLRHLWRLLSPYANITVVAPSEEKSGSGLAVTFDRPLSIFQQEWDGNSQIWSVNGTPADCVKMALNVILETPPDLLLSGINRGSNAGRNILYSGTVAGAIEGSLRDIPSIALSCADYINPDYQNTAKSEYIIPIANFLLDHPLPHGTLLNVTFPGKHSIEKHGGIQGVKMTHQGKGYFQEMPDKRSHPTVGLPYYWLGLKVAIFEEEEDCDISWVEKAFVTIVPIHISELTDHRVIKAKKKDIEALFTVKEQIQLSDRLL